MHKPENRTKLVKSVFAFLDSDGDRTLSRAEYEVSRRGAGGQGRCGQEQDVGILWSVEGAPVQALVNLTYATPGQEDTYTVRAQVQPGPGMAMCH